VFSIVICDIFKIVAKDRFSKAKKIEKFKFLYTIKNINVEVTSHGRSSIFFGCTQYG
jgi:hypothetical protein